MTSELRNNNFTFTFDKLKDLAYTTHDIQIPGMTLGEAIVPYGSLDIYVPGDKLVFDPITITFNVDENLENYIGIYNWMMELGHPDRSKAPNRPDDRDAVSDAIITILNNQKNPIYNINLVDCFPTSLAELPMNLQAADDVICSLTIRYSYFELVSLRT